MTEAQDHLVSAPKGLVLDSIHAHLMCPSQAAWLCGRSAKQALIARKHTQLTIAVRGARQIPEGESLFEPWKEAWTSLRLENKLATKRKIMYKYMA